MIFSGEKERTQYYKLARPDGYDFETGHTVNYREGIGKKVTVPKDQKRMRPILCQKGVLHACLQPNDCFVGAKIPCSAYIVEGRPIVDDGKKFGFRSLHVVEEIPEEKLGELFGFRYSEACNPVHPFKLVAPKVGEEQLTLLRTWDSVRASVWASVWASVGASVWASVGASVWDSVWASVGASVWAYIGSLYPNIKTWKYVTHEIGVYPFQSAVDLWRQGLVPSFDGKVWRLHAGPDARIVFEIIRENMKEEIVDE